MIGALVNLIVYLLILGVLYAIAVYAIDNLVPEPPARIVKVVAVVLIGLAVVLLLLDMIGVGGGLNLPKVVQ